MVGLVVVSHSAPLAQGVVALAREMGGERVAIEAAGGVADAPDALGTDAERVRAAIEAVMSPDGVLVLMDLGSALMSAEFAAELVPGGRILLCGAPLVEGAVAAAAAASGGADLDAVAAEAQGALAMKRAQLEEGDAADGDGADRNRAGGSVTAPAGARSAQLPVDNPIGLHARPAARVLARLRDLDATVTLTRGDRTADARSLTGVISLGARQGDTITAHADGPDAARALDALRVLAAGNWGDRADTAAPGRSPAPPAPADRPGSADAGAGAGGRLAGIPVSAGTAVGPVWRLDGARTITAPTEDDSPATGEPATEQVALAAALDATRTALRADRDRLAGGPGDAGAIFDAHLALLDDTALLDPARAAIDAGASATRAWFDAVTAVAEVYAGLEDPLLRERAADVHDVGRRVMGGLRGEPDHPADPPPTGAIVVADELAPADVAALDPERVSGVATARGSATAHAAILVRALGLAAVVGLGPDLLTVAEGTEVLLDGTAGTLRVAPDPASAAAARERSDELARRRTSARVHTGEPAVTRDGVRIEVLANLGDPDGVEAAVALGAEGVGLLRTEFLYLDRPQLPDEDEQAEALERIAVALGDRPLVVRTLDAGADKPLPALVTEPEANPFLGVRGVRLSLTAPDTLLVQLRAILRVAARRPRQLRLLIPMVSTREEIDAVRSLLDQARTELAITAPLPVGIMIEVPAAALDAARLAATVDFLSIGTNDLTQYTMAAERGNPRVAGLLAGLRPAVRELVRMTVAAAGGRPVAVCGELAGDPVAAVALVRAGVRELSMSAALIPEVKAALRDVTLS